MADDFSFGKGSDSGSSFGGGSFGGGSIGGSTLSSASGAVQALYAAKGYKFKAQGAQFEKQNYDLAAVFAGENVAFTERSTAIKLAQEDRQNLKLIGGQTADVAGAGFATSGSALDLLAESASQSSLTKQVLGFQGQITEAGYQEQQKSYENMSQAAQVAIDAAKNAGKGSGVSAALSGAAAGATAGSVFGPWGTVIGGVVGGAAGYFGSQQ